MKSFCLFKTCLTYTSIHNKNRSIRSNRRFNLKHFIKKRLFLFVTSRSIYNNYFIFLFPEKSDSLLSNLDRVFFMFMTKKRTFNLRSIHLQLFKGSSSKSIRADQANTPSPFHILISKLRTSCGLARPLEPNKHNHIRPTSLKLIRGILTAQHKRELINNPFNNSPPDIHGSNLHIFLATPCGSSLLFLHLTKLLKNLLFNLGSELDDIFDIDIAIEQSIRDFFHDFVDQSLVYLRGAI